MPIISQGKSLGGFEFLYKKPIIKNVITKRYEVDNISQEAINIFAEFLGVAIRNNNFDK